MPQTLAQVTHWQVHYWSLKGPTTTIWALSFLYLFIYFLYCLLWAVPILQMTNEDSLGFRVFIYTEGIGEKVTGSYGRDDGSTFLSRACPPHCAPRFVMLLL